MTDPPPTSPTIVDTPPQCHRDPILTCLLWLGVAVLGVLLWPYLKHWTACLTFPFQLDPEEGYILNQALTLNVGRSIYESIHAEPFVVGNYTPFFPWVYGWVHGWTIGSRPDFVSLPLGRMLVGLATLSVAGGLAWIVGHRTRRLLPAILAPLLFLISYEVYQWSTLVRVDLPALALTVTGLGVFLLSRSRWGMVAAAILFVAAAATRQTALLAPLACAAALAINDRRRFVWFLIPYAVAGLGLIGWLQWRTSGEFFFHVVTYNINEMDWWAWRMVMKNEVWYFSRLWIVALGLGGVALAIGRVRRGFASEAPLPAISGSPRFVEHPHTHHVVDIYMVLSVASLVSYAKVGAAPNYVLEPLAAAALWGMEMLGRLLDRAEEAAASPARIRWGVCGSLQKWVTWGIAMLVLAHGVNLWMTKMRGDMHSARTPDQTDLAGCLKVLEFAQIPQGPVLSSDPIFGMLSGWPVLHQPFIMAQLAREGRWDDQRLIGMLRHRSFDLLIVTEDLKDGDTQTPYSRYTPAMAEAVRRYYRPHQAVVLKNIQRIYYLWAPHPNLGQGDGVDSGG